MLDGGLPASFVYTGGEIIDQELEVVGGASFEGQAFSLAEVDPEAVDRIAAGVDEEAGADVELTQLTLERQPDGELRWLAAAGGRVYSADPSGGEVAAGDVSTATDCAARAGADPVEIQGCSP